MMVKLLVMLLVVLNLCIIDHHGHVVLFVAVKELSEISPSEVLLLRLN